MITSKFTVFFIFLACAVGTTLFYVKYSVITLEDRIRSARQELIKEHKNNHIFKAEYKTLVTPERIQRLALKHLNMKSIIPSQICEYNPAIFHKEKTKYNETKRLSSLVNEIVSSEDND